jgi:hypothetical protein
MIAIYRRSYVPREEATQKKLEKLEVQQQRQVEPQQFHLSGESPSKASASKSKVAKVPNIVVEVPKVLFIAERPRRKPKAPKYLDEFEISTP